MNELTYDAACAYLDTVMIPNSRTGLAIGRLVAEVDRCSRTMTDLAACVHDLLVLLDETDISITEDEPLSLAIERTDQLVHRVQSAPGSAGVAPATQTITQDRVK